MSSDTPPENTPRDFASEPRSRSANESSSRDESSEVLPAVILVRPREDGNVGAAARAMANMGLSKLILVEPATRLGVLGHAFAKGADHIIASLRRVDSVAEAVAPFQRLVGTTSARERTGGQEIIRPRELAPRLRAEDPPGTRTALVFGPEVSGLTKDELALCQPLVNVPCDPLQPTLNLAQSVLILTYELYLARIAAGETEPAQHKEEVLPAAEAGHVNGFFEQAVELLRRVRFDRDDTFSAVTRDMRRLLARAAPTTREVTILRGMCRRVEYQLDRFDDLQRDTMPGSPNPAEAREADGNGGTERTDREETPKRRQPHDWSRPGDPPSG